jgi:LmbE family N-acetylglucosaminyl deacetylase
MNIIAFFAHPDDETMLCGGTLTLLSQNGAHVHYLCATRGEGGELGDPQICTRQELGEVREAEMVCAVGALGGRSLTFLGYTDPVIGPDGVLYAYTENLTMLAGQVAASVAQIDPVALITHGSNGEYGHPAHVLTYQAAQVAVASLGEGAPVLYTVAAAFPEHPKPRLANQDDPAHLVIDVEHVLSEKESAALCHRTQHALFVRGSSEEAGHQMTVSEVIMRVESLHRASPPVEGELDDPVSNSLSPWVLN